MILVLEQGDSLCFSLLAGKSPRRQSRANPQMLRELQRNLATFGKGGGYPSALNLPNEPKNFFTFNARGSRTTGTAYLRGNSVDRVLFADFWPLVPTLVVTEPTFAADSLRRALQCMTACRTFAYCHTLQVTENK